MNLGAHTKGSALNMCKQCHMKIDFHNYVYPYTSCRSRSSISACSTQVPVDFSKLFPLTFTRCLASLNRSNHSQLECETRLQLRFASFVLQTALLRTDFVAMASAMRVQALQQCATAVAQPPKPSLTACISRGRVARPFSSSRARRSGEPETLLSTAFYKAPHALP